jgi:hypothetical protein
MERSNGARWVKPAGVVVCADDCEPFMIIPEKILVDNLYCYDYDSDYEEVPTL